MPSPSAISRSKVSGGGNATINSGQEQFPLNPLNEGKVCVNEDGIDTCEPAIEPVEGSTWGQIKSAYSR